MRRPVMCAAAVEHPWPLCQLRAAAQPQASLTWLDLCPAARPCGMPRPPPVQFVCWSRPSRQRRAATHQVYNQQRDGNSTYASRLKPCGVRYVFSLLSCFCERETSCDAATQLQRAICMLQHKTCAATHGNNVQQLQSAKGVHSVNPHNVSSLRSTQMLVTWLF